MEVSHDRPQQLEAAVREVAIGHTALCTRAPGLNGIKSAVASRFTICPKSGKMQRCVHSGQAGTKCVCSIL